MELLWWIDPNKLNYNILSSNCSDGALELL